MYNGKHILIEHGPGIGDLITLTPSLKRLKELYPQCVLSITSNEHVLQIIKRLPYIDNVYGIKKHKFLGRYYPALHLPKQDYVILFSWQSHLAWAAKFLNVHNRYGFCREKYQKYNLFHKDILSQSVKDVTRRSDFLANESGKVLGISLKNNGICEVSQPTFQEEQEAKNILRNNSDKTHITTKYAVIAPFGNTARNLPKELVIESIKYLSYQSGYTCVLVNNNDNKFAHELKSLFDNNVVNLCGQTTLMQMVAILKNAKLCLSTDSAPMHISSALKTPCVTVFSNDSSYKWAPKQYCLPIDLHVPCSPCRPENANKCSKQICINNITSSMIINLIEQLHNIYNI